MLSVLQYLILDVRYLILKLVKYYLVCPLGVIGGREELLTYSFAGLIGQGAIVKIPFGHREKLGVVMRQTQQPSFATKPIISVIEENVPTELLRLAEWMSEYYASRLPVVLQTILPKGLEKSRRIKPLTRQRVMRTSQTFTLNVDQKNAVEKILNADTITHLIHGVTGSGKTRVYQELAKKMLIDQRSVIVLVPEISLTPQLAAEFETLSENVLVLHSGLGEAERHTTWKMLGSTTKPWIVVGPRSALFSPLSNLGLIIIDECHEPSFVQDSQPKYSALRVARKRAELSPGTKLVLGSATPLITDYAVAVATKTPILKLPLPTQQRSTNVKIVDIKNRDEFGSHPLFSKLLLEKMNNSIVQNEQILLFHNRRGTARMSLCSNCGWTAECTQCHIPMRLHHDTGDLRCHVCGLKNKLPQTCPLCKSPHIDFKGFGSKRIESDIRKLYPNAVIARFDSDTPAKQQLQHRYQDLYDNKIQIIIGTQGLAKGLDLPHLNTVGIIQADSELFIPDFSSAERSFQLTTQVIGRAGRTGAKSSVIIQTLNPDHPAVTLAADQNYEDFYQYEIQERAAEHMPPHSYLLQVSTGYATPHAAESAAKKLQAQIKKAHPSVHVRGPSPTFHEHRGTLYYQQLVISSSTRTRLVAIAKELPQRWQFTLDPINLL